MLINSYCHVCVVFNTYRVILGGGVVKHHTCNANLMRNGAEYSVYINTGQVLHTIQLSVHIICCYR